MKLPLDPIQHFIPPTNTLTDCLLNIVFVAGVKLWKQTPFTVLVLILLHSVVLISTSNHQKENDELASLLYCSDPARGLYYIPWWHSHIQNKYS